MASRKPSVAPSSFKNSSSEEKSLKSGSTTNKPNNSGTTKKLTKPSGNIVKSRYLQALEKTSLSKSNSLSNDSTAAPLCPSSPKPSSIKPKLGTPTRRSIAPQALGVSAMTKGTDPSLLGKSVLQSTFSDGHCFRPDFDISVIKEKTVIETTGEAEKSSENEKRIVEMQAFLLAYLTAKIEHNNTKYKNEAEALLLKEMEEQEKLLNKVTKMKRQYLAVERKRNLNEQLDLQIETLTPVAEAAKQFTKDYNCFASAVDATCHMLPVKNFYIGGDGKKFLVEAEARLKETEALLLESIEGNHEDTSGCLKSLGELKKASKDISQQLSGSLSELMELSSLACQHSVHVQQAIEEEQLGVSRTRELFCQKQ